MALEQLYFPGMLIGLGLLIAVLVALVVVAGKIGLILQHNQSTDLRLPFQQFALAMAQHADLASVYHRGLQGFTGLSAEEQVRFFMVATLVFNYWSDVYEQNRKGVIPPSNRVMQNTVLHHPVRPMDGTHRLSSAQALDKRSEAEAVLWPKREAKVHGWTFASTC
ncbi:MAG: hypothetical protein HYR49_07790 [Gammaproteobacteria bacterium]|nr:hypothetical protein [Gammaproteobacteria bacterium]